MRRRAVLATMVLMCTASVAPAHPVPKNTHDRTLVVHLEGKPDAGLLTVRVNYRLEVDELTAFAKDLEPYLDDIDALQYRGKPLQLYDQLARRLGPDLAFRLTGKANGKQLDFKCTNHAVQLHEKDGTPLGHLRCDFVFTASFAPSVNGDNTLAFRDQTYFGEEGKVDVSLAIGDGLRINSKTVADDAVKKRALVEREPGDDDRLREVHVVFAIGSAETTHEATPTPPVAAPPPVAPDDHSLFRLLMHADYGFWLTMLMACIFGAAHALTPGHGKTLVAAYLVGERGTIWHAIFLGIVTTLTHTGIVIAIAVVLAFLSGPAREIFLRALQHGLGLVMGLLVTCMGFWLLLQRLSGRADHVHIGGGHHHHHHGNPDAGVRNHETAGVRWWGLIVLGVAGGLVPCWDAIYLLLFTVGRSQFMIALPAVLAFSAGLAGVLVLVGVLVVQVPQFARSRWGNGTIVSALPIASAVVVTAMGVWLCYEGVHGQ
jgi:ABC-type nickel/cobalt efflux system permease component RcnA